MNKDGGHYLPSTDIHLLSEMAFPTFHFCLALNPVSVANTFSIVSLVAPATQTLLHPHSNVSVSFQAPDYYLYHICTFTFPATRYWLLFLQLQFLLVCHYCTEQGTE
ncbi:hypothetical protein TraAM80_00292 [Trypanosoma rangeli]|uniref:Uncharacterized protein n=1 Tax=Trypanosoma rangeli TaxID=5698 RepID=A0A422P3Y5_TRYRA|nr:uncharacterized protein TraAM80_00292 [Trypanosoma rangeli]RNF12440.1 hypothetical protein TraAM80_00292 [Trypanosoma rangeli]|eukprot:RNF12440.1 hypothetical protein TraAM80_00292 [Trypanosoma rangeli]